jgi:hypothetical protein
MKKEISGHIMHFILAPKLPVSYIALRYEGSADTFAAGDKVPPAECIWARDGLEAEYCTTGILSF